MEKLPTLLPSPRHLSITEGFIWLSNYQLILLDCDHPQSLLFSATRIQNALSVQLNLKYEITHVHQITDRGDNDQWQVLPVSNLGFAGGAAYSCSFTTNQFLDIRAVLNQYAVHGPSNSLDAIAYDLGNVYHEIGIEPKNSSALFHIPQKPIRVC